MLKAEGNNWFYGSDSPDNQGKPPPESGSKASFTMIWFVPVLRYLVTIEGTNIGLQNEPVKVLLPILLTGISLWNGREVAVDLAEHRGEHVKGDPICVNAECMDGGDLLQGATKETGDESQKDKAEVSLTKQKKMKREREDGEDQGDEVPPPKKTSGDDQAEKINLLALQLIRAIHYRELDAVKHLFENEGANPDIPWGGEYPLHLSLDMWVEPVLTLEDRIKSYEIFLLVINKCEKLEQRYRSKTLLERLFDEIRTPKRKTNRIQIGQSVEYTYLESTLVALQLLLECGARISLTDFVYLLHRKFDGKKHLRSIALESFKHTRENPEEVMYDGLPMLHYIWFSDFCSFESARWLTSDWGLDSALSDNFSELFIRTILNEYSRYSNNIPLKVRYLIEQFGVSCLLSGDKDENHPVALLLKIDPFFSFDHCAACKYCELTDFIVDLLASHGFYLLSYQIMDMSLAEFVLVNPSKYTDKTIRFVVVNAGVDPSLLMIKDKPVTLYIAKHLDEYSDSLYSWLLDRCKQSPDFMPAHFGQILIEVLSFKAASTDIFTKSKVIKTDLVIERVIDLINRGADCFVSNHSGACPFVLIFSDSWLEHALGQMAPDERVIRVLGSYLETRVDGNYVSSIKIGKQLLLSYLMKCWCRNRLSRNQMDSRIQVLLNAGYIPGLIETIELSGDSLDLSRELNWAHFKVREKLGLKYLSLLAVLNYYESPGKESVEYELFKNIRFEALKKLVKVRHSRRVNENLWRLVESLGDKDEMQRSLREGADINALMYGKSPLHMAVENNDIEIVDLLLSSGADIELKDSTGLTPLLISCSVPSTVSYYLLKEYVKKLAVLQLLLDRGADIQARSKAGRTSLHMAALGGHMEAVEELLKRKSHIEAKDNKGFTALHLAVYNGHVDIAKKFLEEGAEVDSISNEGGTPLFWAANGGDKDIVMLLLANGADPTISDAYGTLPEDAAESKGFHDCAGIIIRHRNEFPDTDDPQNQ